MPRVKKEKSAKPVKLGSKKKPKYSVTVSYNEKDVELKGDSLEQIFLDYEPEPFKSLVWLTIKSGKTEVKRFWPVMKAKRVFRNAKNAVIEGSLLEKLFV